MKVVLDTNVLLVSISDRSPYHWIFKSLLNGEFELCITTAILMEYAEIIEQHMGTMASESVMGVIDNLSNITQINSYFRFDLIKKDPDDNKFVDCAIASNAEFIVTEDKDFQVLQDIDFPKVEVLKISEFKEKLEVA